MAGVGCVYLVGAGPGDPGLITVAGLRRLKAAEVLVYDHLAGPPLVAEAPPEAERIYVGKQAGDHTLDQDGINRLLVERAREGKRVVRLKGGDPYVFGRGGEEAAFLREHGIPFEVVPGVTAASAVLAAAGIPLTHRGLASIAVLVTGQEDPTKPASDIDWSALARIKGTLVFYMGVRNAAAISEALVREGRPPATPAAMIRAGTLPDQRTVVGTLADIAERTAAADLRPPALFVVGEVVQLREALNWFERRPLFGKTVVVTRARDQASALVERLSTLGAAVVEFPTIRIEPPEDFGPLDRALGRLREFDWIALTSANAVQAVMGRLAARTLDARALAGVKLAVVGPATAEALRACGLLPDLMPNEYTSAGLAAELKAHTALKGARVLYPKADLAPEDLEGALTKEGAVVTAPIAYRTVPAEPDPEAVQRLTAGQVDWVTFTSSSTARNFAAVLGPERLREVAGRVRFASIGPKTTATAEFLGLTIAIEATESTLDGLVEALVSMSGRETE